MDVAAWRKSGGPARALQKVVVAPAAPGQPQIVRVLVEDDQAREAVHGLAGELHKIAKRLEALPTGVQHHELAALVQRLAGVEVGIGVASQAMAEARRAATASNDLGTAITAVRREADAAGARAQTALAEVRSIEAVATTARGMAAKLWPEVGQIRELVAGIRQQVDLAVQASGAVGVFVRGVRREGRLLVVTYSSGFEETIDLPDDRRLLAFNGALGGSDLSRAEVIALIEDNAGGSVAYTATEYLDDQTVGGVAAVLTFTFSAPVDRVTVQLLAVDDTDVSVARVRIDGGAPDADTGAEISAGVPTPYVQDGIAAVKVYAPANYVVAVWGQRR